MKRLKESENMADDNTLSSHKLRSKATRNAVCASLILDAPEVPLSDQPCQTSANDDRFASASLDTAPLSPVSPRITSLNLARLLDKLKRCKHLLEQSESSQDIGDDRLLPEIANLSLSSADIAHEIKIRKASECATVEASKSLSKLPTATTTANVSVDVVVPRRLPTMRSAAPQDGGGGGAQPSVSVASHVESACCGGHHSHHHHAERPFYAQQLNLAKGYDVPFWDSAPAVDHQKLADYEMVINCEMFSGVEILRYESEEMMPAIMRLIQKDLSEPYSIYTYRYFIHNWPRLCFLAKAENEYIGAIVCKLDYHKTGAYRGYIAMLAVDEKYRRKKIGSRLVQKAILNMIANDCDEVVLETEVTNKSALNLYEKLGFVRDKRLFRYYLNGVDAYRLKLWLKAPILF